MSPEIIQTVVTNYFNTLQAMNAVDWADNFTEDAMIQDPVGKPANNARENAQKFLGLLAMVFAELKLSQDQIFIAGDCAAVKWTLQGWGKDGKQGTAEGISVFEIHPSGKIQRVSSYWDDAALIAQMRS